MSETIASNAAPAAGPTVPGALPKCIVHREDGLYVVLSQLESRTLLLDFIDQTFSSDFRFAGLDYACLQKLLYDYEPGEIAQLAAGLQKAGKSTFWRLASGVVPFPADRQQCYRNVKMVDNGQSAEYLFEPVFIDKVVEEPAAGATDEESASAKSKSKLVSERAELNIDEFIAAMWCRGVRFGIDVAAVAKALANSKVENAIVARMRPPTPGRDAQLIELVNSLHRDNTPKLLADGRVDLHQFQNRFPQVEKNSRLLKKIPRELGKVGWDISGNEIQPDVPKDLDLEPLAGAGLQVQRTGEGEFLVAAAGGFLQIDTATHSFSITEKIVNREGVSVRTTGNLALSGEEYEEHGEVAEHSQIEGKNMSFMADVYGHISSHGGRLTFKRNLASGSAKSPGGTIQVEGSASQATLEAIGGEITVNHAQGCLIIGKKVTIGKAVHCDILAEELVIESATGCALAAQRVNIANAAAWRDSETTVSMVIPDFEGLRKQADEVRKQLAEREDELSIKAKEIDAITAQPDVKTFSMISAKLRAKEITMTAEQESNWQKLQSRILPALRQLKELNPVLNALRSDADFLRGKIQEIAGQCNHLSENIECTIQSISGEVVVRTFKLRPDAPPLHALAARDLRICLRASGSQTATLFNASQGTYAWKFAGGGIISVPEKK